MIIEMLRRQVMEKDSIISSMERLPRPMSSSSPQNSQQNIRKSSVESMHSLACSPGSSSSLQNLMQRSPVSSQQNLAMRSPSGSHQSLAVKGPSRGPGSQERLLELSGSHTSLSTSGLSTAGTGKHIWKQGAKRHPKVHHFGAFPFHIRIVNCRYR